MPSVEIGHPAVPRRHTRLWYSPKSAFAWHRLSLSMPKYPERMWHSCETCGLTLQLKVTSDESPRAGSRRTGIAAAGAWGGFAILLLLSFRSNTAPLTVADVVIGIVSILLLSKWVRYSLISRTGRWHGHRIRH